MSDPAPLISVIVPAYRHEDFVEECLRSVFEQTHRPVELIVIDDASPDATFEVIQRVTAEAPFPVTVRRNDRNLGLCATLNRALTLARGEYVCFVASDDALSPEKLSTQAKFLAATSDDVGACESDMLLIDRVGRPIRHFSCKPAGGEVDYVRLLQMKDNAFLQACLFKASVFNELGGFDETLRFEDWDFMLRVLRRYRVPYIPGEVVRYRYLETSLSKRLGKHEDDYWRIAAKHLDDPRVLAFGRRRIEGAIAGALAKQQYFEGNRARARQLAAIALAKNPGDPSILRTLAVASLPEGLKAKLRRLRDTVRAR
jgi:glycosyltransferase involved in cell wall biosynthesis